MTTASQAFALHVVPFMGRFQFTAGRVAILCVWSFLLGAWISYLALHLEGGQPVPRESILGLLAAGGSLLLWMTWSRAPR